MLKKETLAALKSLREVFGGGLIARLEDSGHPWINLLWNQIPDTRRRIIRISKIMEALVRQKHFPLIAKRLLDTKTYYPTINEVEVACAFIEAGYEITIQAPTDKPTTDLLVTHNGRELLIEVTLLEESARDKQAGKSMERIRTAFLRTNRTGRAILSYRLQGVLEGPYLEDLVSTITNSTELVAEGKADFFDLSDKHLIDCYVTSHDGLTKVPKHLHHRRIGPFVGKLDDEFRRLRNKINEKTKRQSPSVLIIFTPILRHEIELRELPGGEG